MFGPYAHVSAAHHHSRKKRSPNKSITTFGLYDIILRLLNFGAYGPPRVRASSIRLSLHKQRCAGRAAPVRAESTFANKIINRLLLGRFRAGHKSSSIHRAGTTRSAKNFSFFRRPKYDWFASVVKRRCVFVDRRTYGNGLFIRSHYDLLRSANVNPDRPYGIQPTRPKYRKPTRSIPRDSA